MFKLPDDSAMPGFLLRICFGGIGLFLALVVVPPLTFLVGAAGLLAFPVTFFVLGSIPVGVAAAAKRLGERPLWVVLACAPLVGFALVYVDGERVFDFLAKASGSAPAVAKANLGPPLLAGFGFGAIFAYVAVLSGALWIRLRFVQSAKPGRAG